MTHLKHKKPCNDCPFRKKAPAGWLGANEPRAFAAHAQASGLPCHSTVDYESDDWESEQEEAPTCAGSLIMMKNAAMLPYTKDLQQQVAAVERSDDVFPFVGAFIAHHEQATVRSWDM